MRNIDAKIEGIGFLIAKNEGELENLRIPVGGIVKLQDSGKMLERTASGWKDYEMGGGSSGGGGISEFIQGTWVVSPEIAWKQTDEQKALNAELYTKIISALDNREPVTLFIYKRSTDEQIDMLQSQHIVYQTNGTIAIAYVYPFDYMIGAFRLSMDGSIVMEVMPTIPSK